MENKELEVSNQSNNLCQCGVPVFIKKRGLCKRCYAREYMRMHKQKDNAEGAA